MKDRRKALVEALESGKYKQTNGVLCERDGKKYSYCCLGVACRVYEKETGKRIAKFDKDSLNMVFGKDKQVGVLPEEVQEYFDFKTDCGSFDIPIKEKDNHGDESKSITLIGLNDGLGWNFEQIAKFIKSNPKGLFGKTKKKKDSIYS